MYAVLLKIDFLTPLRFLACFSSEKSRFDDPEPRGAARGREQVEKRRRHAAEKRLAECSKKLERASRHFQGEVTARRLREQELGQTRLEMSRLCVPLSHPRIVTAHPLSPSHCCIGLPSPPPLLHSRLAAYLCARSSHSRRQSKIKADRRALTPPTEVCLHPASFLFLGLVGCAEQLSARLVRGTSHHLCRSPSFKSLRTF